MLLLILLDTLIPKTDQLWCRNRRETEQSPNTEITSSFSKSSIQLHLASLTQSSSLLIKLVGLQGNTGSISYASGAGWMRERQSVERKPFIQPHSWRGKLEKASDCNPSAFYCGGQYEGSGTEWFWLGLVCVSCMADHNCALYLAH